MNTQYIIDEIIEQARRRQDVHPEEKALTLRCKAICRRLSEGGDKIEADAIYKSALNGLEHPKAANAYALIVPFLEARTGIEKHRAAIEKRMKALAQQLPIWERVKDWRGVAPLGLACIIGEAGDLSNYANPAKLWKRMGLAVMNGNRQGRPGEGATAADWTAHGYSPRRRSATWVIGDSMIKVRGEFRPVYDERKAYLVARAEGRGLKVVPAAKIKKGAAGFVSEGHIHNDAKRYMEKRMLLMLWRAWRGEGVTHGDTHHVSAFHSRSSSGDSGQPPDATHREIAASPEDLAESVQ